MRNPTSLGLYPQGQGERPHHLCLDAEYSQFYFYPMHIHLNSPVFAQPGQMAKIIKSDLSKVCFVVWYPVKSNFDRSRENSTYKHVEGGLTRAIRRMLGSVHPCHTAELTG